MMATYHLKQYLVVVLSGRCIADIKEKQKGKRSYKYAKMYLIYRRPIFKVLRNVRRFKK